MRPSEINELYFKDMGFCGCYTPGQIWEDLRLGLNLLHERSARDWSPAACAAADVLFDQNDNRYLWMLYVMDAVELTEHGGSVGGSWLTQKGERLRAALNAFDPEWATDDWRDGDPDEWPEAARLKAPRDE